jgi:creatinine amidohydrolase
MPVLARAQQDTRNARPAAPRGKIVTIGNVTWKDVDALSRDSTIFLLTVGMLEEHGPHLPIATDQIAVEYDAAQVATRLSRALRGWNVVVMPTIAYGSVGANQIGNIAIHPGTYAIRQSTLRSLVADIGGQIAQNRFKWIFVMTGHGPPPHHIAINEACDFVSEVFNVTMLNVSALIRADSSKQAQSRRLAPKYFSPADLASFGMDVHAGVGETSELLAIRPDLVRSSYRSLPSYRAESFQEMRAIAERPGWQGYFSSPGKANAAYGREFEAWWTAGLTDLILQAVRGENLLARPRFPGNLQNDPRAQIIDEVLASEREFELKLERWLAQRQKK